MDYYLYPPHFVIEPQTNFGDAWADFCRRLLSLEYRTVEIQSITPPDKGVDILWDAKGIAYQCKSVVDGKAGSMNLAELKESIQTALKYRSQLGWRKYVLCTNVNLTGSQRLGLKKILPDIEFLGAGAWIDLCKKFSQFVADRFNVLVPMPISQRHVLRSLNEAYLHDYLKHFDFSKQRDVITLFVYSKRRNYMFELPFPSSCSVHDVLITLREIFNLPPPEVIEQYLLVWKYTLSIDGQLVTPDKKLFELIQKDKPVVALWKSVVWYKPPYAGEEIAELEHTGVQTGNWKSAEEQLLTESTQQIVKRSEQKFEEAFVQAISQLECTRKVLRGSGGIDNLHDL